MNRLDPDLQRLFHWAAQHSECTPEAAPFGFSTRVVACRKRSAIDERAVFWRRAVRWCSWVSTFVILAGATFLGSHLWRSPSAYDFTRPYQSLARNMVP